MLPEVPLINDSEDDDDTIQDGDQELDINAPIDVQFAVYHPNVSFINIRALIEKELGV